MRDLTKALELIKEFEGLVDGDKRTPGYDPYMCPAGYWTIGWGHVVRDADGRALRGTADRQYAYQIYPGGISSIEAEQLLRQDIRKFAAGLEALVQVPLTDNQYCALLSFAYNVGLGAVRRSTLLRLLNSGDYNGAANQMLQWVKANGRVLAGLKRRRAAEKQLWEQT